MLARRFTPSSMAIYPSKNAPCTNTSFKSCRCQLNCIIVDSIPPKILPIRSHFRRKLHLFDFSRRKARDKSGVASQSQAIRLAAYTSMRRKAPLGTVAGQPGPRLINKYHTCLRVAKLLQAWLSIPPKILPIRSHFLRKLHLFDFSRRNARDKSGVASPRFPGR